MPNQKSMPRFVQAVAFYDWNSEKLLGILRQTQLFVRPNDVGRLEQADDDFRKGVELRAEVSDNICTSFIWRGAPGIALPEALQKTLHEVSFKLQKPREASFPIQNALSCILDSAPSALFPYYTLPCEPWEITLPDLREQIRAHAAKKRELPETLQFFLSQNQAM